MSSAMHPSSSLIEQALAFHHVGAFADAERIYRQLVEAHPTHAEIQHLLGMVLLQQERSAEAVAHLSKAIELAPTQASFYATLGEATRSIGRTEVAVACFRQAIQLGLETADVFHRLGDALQEQRELPAAVAAYQRAIALAPDNPETHNFLGTAFQELGQLDDAVASFERALQLLPEYLEASTNLGNTLASQKKYEAAIARFQQSLALEPRHALTLLSLGNAWKEHDHPAEAEIRYRHALAVQPDLGAAHYNLGCVLANQEKWQEAIASYQRALEINPQAADVLNNLGMALEAIGEPAKAEETYRSALRHSPDNIEARTNLGNLLTKLGRLADAIQCYRQAFIAPASESTSAPDFAPLTTGMGTALLGMGEVESAMRCYRDVVTAKPGFAAAHFNLGMALLLTGDWPNGWPEFEWRWETNSSQRRDFKQPVWRGESFVGQTILLHAEQGLGDTLHFIRYAPLVKQRGGRVIVECQRPLEKILSRCEGIDELIPHGAPLPPFDLHLPLMSLPLVLQTTVANLPATVPYVHPDPALVESWRQRLAGWPEMKVAINWQGNPKFGQDRTRSVPLRHFLPLAEIPGVRFFSVQKGFGREQLDAVHDRLPVVDLADELDQQTGPFMDTAAVLKNMDLVITSDTAVPHLAGALGVPVWMAVSFVPDWRWLLTGEACPWYPTMRLFRQTSHGDWPGVFQHIAANLRSVVTR